MIVVDIETTGTNANKNSISSIGAVDFLHPENRFYEECRIWEGAHIDKEALAVNGFSEEEVRDPKKQSEGELVANFLKWKEEREDQTFAGHNPQFDLGFTQAAAYRSHIDMRIAHRSLDLHSITYFHMIRRGITPPVINKHSALNSDLVMTYVGIPTEPRPHKALNGAIWETEAFYRLLYDKPFLSDFEKYPVPWVKG